jgi:hypothetical protein
MLIHAREGGWQRASGECLSTPSRHHHQLGEEKGRKINHRERCALVQSFIPSDDSDERSYFTLSLYPLEKISPERSITAPFSAV